MRDTFGTVSKTIEVSCTRVLNTLLRRNAKLPREGVQDRRVRRRDVYTHFASHDVSRYVSGRQQYCVSLLRANGRSIRVILRLARCRCSFYIGTAFRVSPFCLILLWIRARGARPRPSGSRRTLQNTIIQPARSAQKAPRGARSSAHRPIPD